MAGFDPSLKCPTCLAILKSFDTMKQSVCGWLYIYIYIYIYTYIYIYIYIYTYIYIERERLEQKVSYQWIKNMLTAWVRVPKQWKEHPE